MKKIDAVYILWADLQDGGRFAVGAFLTRSAADLHGNRIQQIMDGNRQSAADILGIVDFDVQELLVHEK